MDALLVCFEPQNLLVNIVSGFFIGLIYFWILQTICPPRSRWLYWTVNVTALFLMALFKPLIPSGVRIAFGLISAFLLPVLTTKGSVSRRIILCLLCLLLQFIAESAAAVMWVSLTGLETMDNMLALEHVDVFLTVMLAGHGVLLPALMLGLRYVCNRFFPAKVGAGEHPEGKAPLWLRRFVLFPLLQLALLYVLMGIAFDVLRGPFPYVVVLLALLVLCAAADMVLLVQVWRSMEKRQADLEAALLEERVSAYLREAESVQDLLADTARLRHDLRNHMSVVQFLAERGEYAEAQRYLEEARAQMK